MAMWKQLWTLPVLAGLVACASNPPPMPVGGETRGLAALAGEWAGSYVGHESGRSGSILFRLKADADTAYGDVLMVPRRLRNPVAERGGGEQPPDRPTPIGIRFVLAMADSVYGQLDEYRDPEDGCRLLTVFRGHLVEDEIDGVFRTRHEGGKRHSGTWHVERKAP